MKGAVSPARTVRISPETSGSRIRDILAARELLSFLAWRDIKVRYAQAAIGAGWAVLQPVLMMVIFAVFFGHLGNLPSDGLPYAVFAFIGLIPWTFFANAVGSATQSLVANSNLITKVYFPRSIIPLASVASWLPDLAIGGVLLLGILPLYGLRPSVFVMFLPLIAVLTVLVASTTSLGLAALNVRYRDVRYAVPFLLQVWFFLTPVVYPTTIVPERYRLLFALNPMTGVVEGFRWALLRRTPAPWGLLCVSAGMTLVLLIGSAVYFRRVEQDFADVI